METGKVASGENSFSEMDMMAWIRYIYVLSQAAGGDQEAEHVAGGILDLMLQGFGADGGYLALPE